MVLTPLMQRGYEVIIPKTMRPSPAAVSREQLLVSVTRQGSILFRGELLGLEELRERLFTVLRKSPDKTVFLSADADVSYGSVVSVMDRIRSAGAERLAIAPTSDPPTP
jgi:biopolymer transport protein TolR